MYEVSIAKLPSLLRQESFRDLAGHAELIPSADSPPEPEHRPLSDARAVLIHPFPIALIRDSQ
jgi:hypothetical protein